MWPFAKTSIQPIGLDIGHDSVKMLQLEVTGTGEGRSLSVVAAAKVPLPDGARRDPARRAQLAGDVINKALTQQPFVGRDVVATLPRELVHVKNLRLPPIPDDELEEAIRFEARAIFPFEPGDARVEYLPAGEVRQGNESRQEVILLAVKNTDIEQYLRQLDAADVHVRGLDTEITGLFRTFERYVRRREDESEAQMLIDIGARRTQVVIGKGRDVGFYKPVELGGLHFLDAISRKLGITVDEARALRRRLVDSSDAPADTKAEPGQARRDPVRQAVFDATRSVAEDLGRELAMCLRYFSVTFRGHKATRARVVGGEASDPQLRAAFEAALDIPVEAGRPLFSVDTSRMRPTDRRGPMSEWALAVGLGMRFVPGYFSPKDGKPRRSTAAHHPEAATARPPAAVQIEPADDWEVARA
jgi:type IV pilus assembly protein PilM